MIDIKRLDGETEEELLYRIGQRKEEIGTWEDIADIMNNLLGYDYGEAKYRKQFAIIKKILETSDSKIIFGSYKNDGDVENNIEQLKEIKEELYKERCKIQDANREKRSLLREEARFENLKEVLRDNLNKFSNFKVAEYKPLEKNTIRKPAILQLSDWHCGAIIKNQFNTYNVEKLKKRATIIRDKTLDYCQQHGVTDLVIEINGDMINGQIHVSNRVQSEESAVQQIVTVSDILAKIINSLKPYFNAITIVTTLGNHGRLLSNKSETITNENFEMLIPIMLRDKLQDVKVIDSQGFDFVTYKLQNKVIMLSHGQNDKLNKTISDFSKMFKVVPNEVHLGHTHSYQDINDCNVNVTVNGSLMGSDDYAISIRKITKPSQNLIIYDNDRCIYELMADA